MSTLTETTPATFLPVRSESSPRAAVPRAISTIKRNDVLALVGSLGAAAATTAALVSLMPITGPIAWVLLGYALFLSYYATLVSLEESAQVVRARLASVVIHTLSLVLLAVLILVVGYTLARGGKAMMHWNFYTQDMEVTRPTDPLSVGGIKHAIVGTLEQITIALIITVPLGVLCAVYLNEFPGRFARLVRTIVEAMTALPSVIAGLFIYAVWIVALGHEKSGYAAAFAISVMMLPIIIRAADVVLRLVPGHLKEASYALGTSHWRTVWHVVLPTTRSGLTTAVILGAARGIGETSPVLLTAGFNNALNANPAKGPQVSLPLQAFSAVRSPQETMITRGFGTAAFLLVLVLVMFIVARVIGGRGPGQLNARQRRKIARNSQRDHQRFVQRAQRAVIRAGAVVGALGLLAGVTLHQSQPASAADGYVPISGSGSSWSANAIKDWQANVVQYGMKINYNDSGSSVGRNEFKNATVDFGVSEIPYGLTDGGVTDDPPSFKYAYMPIVAGGTAFMYNLKIGGKQVTNLRLSGTNVARIFTGKATMWNDAAIKADNPGLALPARRIVPVVRSDGSGTTAQLTTWFSKRYQSLWDPYCKSAGRKTPCGITSSYPVKSGSGFTAQSGSLGVSGYVAQKQNEGTITYVEYSYAKSTGFPVAKLLNKKGYYVEPKAENVAVGLLKAQINDNAGSANYLTQILDGVYDNPDARAYPLSSYSYMIVPLEVRGAFSTSKGKTLAAFANYFLCDGQQQADTLGYSPLPRNLVQAGLNQVKRIPGSSATVDISKCRNPTFSSSSPNLLATTAKFPPACDKIGKTQCTTGTGGAKAPTGSTSGGGSAPSSDGGTAGTPGTGDAATPGTDIVAAPIDPDTGQPVATDGQSSSQPVSGTPQNLGASYSTATQRALMVIAGLALLLVVMLPPLVSQLVRRRTP